MSRLSYFAVVALLLWLQPTLTLATSLKQKPARLKRPQPAPVTGDRLALGRSVPAAEPVATQSATIQAVGAGYTNTPPPSANFQALLSDGTAFNPDTQGAVGPNHLMVTLNTEVRIQTRSGTEVSRMSLDAWWTPVGVPVNVFDPRIVYDPYGQRWIFSANNDPGGSNPGLLIAVSAGTDPTGTWYRRFIDINASRPVFADSPTVGFNRNWIVLSSDTYTNSNFEFGGAEIYVYNKTNFYANGTLPPMKTNYSRFDVGGLVPALTYDANSTTNYLVSIWNPRVPNPEGDRGYVSLYLIRGPVTAPIFEEGNLGYAAPWEDLPSMPNLAPQSGTASRIALGDSRMVSATFREGTIQCAHTVFLPVGAGTNAAVQWWELTADALPLHQGRIEDPSGQTMYAYPSIAANRNNDIVVGYTRFSTTSFPSAGYRYREDLGDPVDTLRNEVLYKAGVAAYSRTNSLGENLWGDWSATAIDPLNDTDFWTIQEYAEAPQGATSRWGTWWARVSPPNDLVLTVTDSPDPVHAGASLTYNIAVTNLLGQTAVGRRAGGVIISNAIPAGFSFVSASASQGSCGLVNGAVICDLGNLTNRTRATATIVLRPHVVGTVQNTIAVHANGPDADPSDNSVTVSTTTLEAADLAVFADESADPVPAGNNLIYSILVTNRGPSTVLDARLTNNLPASCTFISAISSIGTCNNSGTLVTCNFGQLAANGTATVTITARPNTGGITISNRATVAASLTDGDPANNVASTLTYVNARPTISSIVNRTINEDTTTGLIPFTIGDIETPAANLELSTSSSTPSVIPDGNVILGGSGASRNVTVTPAPNQSGSSIISISVSDGLSTTTTNFTVTVLAANDAPTITPIADPAPIDEDTATPAIPFTIGDIESAVEALVVTRNSSNPTLVPIANIVIEGSGASRTVRVTPATNQTGTATITITVSDGVASSNETFVVTVNQINDPPVISALADRVVNEDTSTGAIPFQIIDVESGGALTLSAISSNPSIVPTNNVVFSTTGTNRTVTILPATNQFGAVQITVVVSDGSLTDSDSFTLTINPVNDAPTLNALSNISTNEDAGQIVVPLLGISSGAANEPQPLTITASTSNPAVIESATVVYTDGQPNGSLILQTATNASGVSTITVTVQDNGSSNNVLSRPFTVTLSAVNDRPMISGIPNQNIDEDTVAANIPFTISDAETAAISLSLSASSSDPSIVPAGNITFGGSGGTRTVTVRPATNQAGSVTITITVSDGLLTQTSSFLLTINPMNDPPRFLTVPANTSTTEDTLTTVNFSIGDPDNQNLNVAVESSNVTLLPPSNIMISGTGTNRSVVFRPATNEVGMTTITLTVSDGILTALHSFDVTVVNMNDAPYVATPIANQTIAEDTATPVIPFTVEDEETPAANLTVTATTSNPTLIPQANIVLTGAGTPNRTIRVTPAQNQFGVATITINVNDGLVTGMFPFTITVNSVNDLPTITSLPNVVTNEDFPTVALPFTIGDVETPAANLVLAGTSSNPQLVSDSGIIFAGTGTARSVTVRPLTNRVGTATIAVSVTDGSNAVAMAEFDVTFTAVNDRPVIQNLTNLTVPEDTNSVVINFTVDDPETRAQNLLVGATSSNQSLVPNSSLTLGGFGTNRSVTIVPARNQSGVTTITLSVTDGAFTTMGSFVLTVAAVNDAPTISAIGDATIAEDTVTGPINFTVDDVETLASSLTLSASSSNPLLTAVNFAFGGSGANRTVTVRPPTNFFGTAGITITVSDGAATGTSTFTLTATPVNDPPTLNPVANVTISEDATLQTVSLSGISAGPANENQTATITASSSNPGAINPAVNYAPGAAIGTLTFVPTANATGMVVLTVTVRDGQPDNGSTSRSFTVTINGVNDPPTISNIPNLTTGEDTPITTQFTIGDIETPVSALTLTGTSSNPTLLANTNIIIHGSGATRTLMLLPSANQFGSSTVTVTVGDGVTTATDTLVLTVNSTNDAPTLDPIRDVYLNEGPGSVTVTLTGISSGAPNEAQPLTVRIDSTTGTLTFQNQPAITYTSPGTTASLTFRPNQNSTGNSLITVSVSENTNINPRITRSFNVYVKPTANSFPTISAITNRSTGEDTPITIPFTIADPGASADLLILTAFTTNLTLFPPGSFFFAGSGANRTVTVTPATNLSGSASISIGVRDGGSGGAFSTFILTVTPSNDLPAISMISPQNIGEDGSTGPVPFIIRDAETPAANLTLSAVSSNPGLVPNSNVVFGGSGTNRVVTVTPLANQSGLADITVVVTDGNLATASTTFTVTVGPVNDPPAISPIPDIVTNEDMPSAAVPFTVEDIENLATLTFTATSSNPALIPHGNVTFGGAGASRTVAVSPAPDQFGSAMITVTVSDGSGSPANESFLATVMPVNDPPALNPIANVSAVAGVAITVPLSGISAGPANEAQPVLLSASSSNPALVPHPTISYTSPGTTASLRFTPVPNSNGTVTVTVTANDAQAVNNSITSTFTVDVSTPPSIAITRSGNLVTLSWPAVAANMVLQYRDGVTGSWTDVPGAPIQNSGRVSITQNITAAMRFYRLRN